MTSTTTNDPAPNAVAVIGMAGRFPGADSVSAFWRNLRRAEESIVTLSEDELAASGIGEEVLANRAYVRRAALMNGIAEFDADFFGFTPQAAQMLDPQHRLFLQSSWHALEDAGYEPGGIDSPVGVFGASSASGYLLHNLLSHQSADSIIGQGATFEMVNLSLQNDKDHLATRVAHQLNLHGPALSVQTACSSSLVAVHLACQSILNRECDMALAGGSSIRVPHRVGYWHQPGSMVSATGRCRPFDVRADGTIFGSGVAVLVLKALRDALDDGDRIHAVIRGSAVNNDGATKMTYAAPNADGQAEVVAEAHAVADIDAATVSYVETHGTGTPLGDPVELDGLRQAFELAERERTGPCFIGSVKSNIGHLETASGIAGLVKTILCLEHRALPATLHFSSPNPELHLDDGPFLVRSEDGPWECDGPRRAGVSSFGVGGTNAHVVVEEAPGGSAPTGRSGPQVLLLSARSTEALAEARSELAAELESDDGLDLADVARTLAGRGRGKLGLAAAVKDAEHAVTVLRAAEDDNVSIGETAAAGQPGKRVVFLFPGQGVQHVGMAKGLYEAEPVFAEQFDRCAAAFRDSMEIDLAETVFDGDPDSLERTDRAQPALFAVEYAAAKLIESFGVVPAALAGHSIGEYVAATLAGVFDLETAIEAVSMRARLMHTAPRGVMVAVPLSPDDVAQHLAGDVDIATVNDPGSCVVAGTEDGIKAFQSRVAEAGVTARRVRTSHAFHSRLMDPVIGEFTAFLSRLTLHEPRIALLSNVTGKMMSAAEATDPAMWARQVRETVRFSDELDVLLTEPSRVLVEVGPGGTLTASAMRHPRWSEAHRAVRLMRHQAQKRGDHDAFLLALGQLWSARVDVDWSPLHGDRRPQRVTLPGYPFERQRHWVEHRATTVTPTEPSRTAPDAAGAAQAGAATNGKPQTEETLRRIWAQCLGVDSVDPTANFFELGGDSLIAISVAMTAANEGLDLTPQDLYENPTISALAKSLTARYLKGGLARQSLDDVVHPPVPPNVSHFLGHGLTDAYRWRVPVILRVRPDVPVDDIGSALSAVIEHHDALRLSIERHSGTWRQRVGEPGEFAGLKTLDNEVAAGAEPEAVLEMHYQRSAEQDSPGPPLAATYARDAAGGPAYLVISMHGTVTDSVSRDIVCADIVTAIGQRLAGQDIALQSASVTWRDWSQRCAALVAHPAVLESSDYWLATAGKADVQLAADTAERPASTDLVRLPSQLTETQTTELGEAQRRTGRPIDEMLLAALARTIATNIGAGTVAVDLSGAGRSVLKPDVDLRRTVGWFSTLYPIALTCSADDDTSARQRLDDVHDAVQAVPHYGISYGLLRFLHAPTARPLADMRPADIFFSYHGTIPDLASLPDDDAPVRFDTDSATPVREAMPGLGHAVELRVYGTAGALQLDWWYDQRRIDPKSVEGLADRLRSSLTELAGEVTAADDQQSDDDGDLALLDLSSADSGAGE